MAKCEYLIELIDSDDSLTMIYPNNNFEATPGIDLATSATIRTWKETQIYDTEAQFQVEIYQQASKKIAFVRPCLENTINHFSILENVLNSEYIQAEEGHSRRNLSYELNFSETLQKSTSVKINKRKNALFDKYPEFKDVYYYIFYGSDANLKAKLSKYTDMTHITSYLLPYIVPAGEYINSVNISDCGSIHSKSVVLLAYEGFYYNRVSALAKISDWVKYEKVINMEEFNQMMPEMLPLK